MPDHQRGITVTAGAVVAVTAAAAAVTGSAAGTTPAAGHQSEHATLDAKVMPAPVARRLVTRFRRAHSRRTYTVRSGDTLSGIARQHCGHARDWTGIARANHRRVPDPNAITPGQVLKLACKVVAIALPAARPVAASTDVSAGGSAAVQPSSPAVVVTAVGGVLSSAQVGALWLEAGGPAVAEAQAEEIAMCESGDNPDAYNPSGATGLFQILGAVLPGDLRDPLVNAENAVAKYKASDGWGQWVCQP